MLPPLFLDVEPHHVVLDMCAAPGSKVCPSWLLSLSLDPPFMTSHADVPAPRVTALFSIHARVMHTSGLADSQ